MGLQESIVGSTVAALAAGEAGRPDERDRIFRECRASFEVLARAKNAGLPRIDTARAFGIALATARAEARYPATVDGTVPELVASRRKSAESTSSNRPGGLALSANAVTQRADAWQLAVDLSPEGAEPDLELMVLTFRFTTTGANAKQRAAVLTGGSFGDHRFDAVTIEDAENGMRRVIRSLDQSRGTR